MQKQVLQLDPRDNVLIALTDLKQGQTVEHAGAAYTLVSSIPAKHKFAMHDLAAGGDVVMYGVLVGQVSKPVKRGELLTVGNLHHQAAPFHEKSEEYRWTPPDISSWKQRRFMGYHRADGQVGTRNYWLVVPLVFCENRNIVNLKQAFEEELGFAAPQIYRQQVAELASLYRQGRSEEIKQHRPAENLHSAPSNKLFEHLDGIRFLLHEGGCGGTREDSNNLCGLIAGYINHPNVAGATVLSLGCQHAQVGILRQEIRRRNPNFVEAIVHPGAAAERIGICDALGGDPPDVRRAGARRTRRGARLQIFLTCALD